MPTTDRYVVLHSALGRYWAGETITPAHLGPDANLARLLELGALAPADSRAAQDLLTRLRTEGDLKTPEEQDRFREIPLPGPVTAPPVPADPAPAPAPTPSLGPRRTP